MRKKRVQLSRSEARACGYYENALCRREYSGAFWGNDSVVLCKCNASVLFFSCLFFSVSVLYLSSYISLFTFNVVV